MKYIDMRVLIAFIVLSAISDVSYGQICEIIIGFTTECGTSNAGFGYHALSAITTGSNITANGVDALYANTTGNDNTASGEAALYSNTIGNYNSASGQAALYFNTSGNGNDASGHAALYLNTTGSYNVAIGYGTGYNQTTGSNNIYISHRGVSGESGVTRIGTANTQTETYIAGIENAKITGSAVYVTASGQLGVLASSERYKTAIAPLGASNVEKLKQLRPVSFHLKSDPNRTIQYGLIAEEVNKVYPELVIRDEAGKIQGVHYEELAPMLLSEVQKQAAEIRDLKQQVAELNDLRQKMRAAVLKTAIDGSIRRAALMPERVNGLETHLFTSLASNWV